MHRSSIKFLLILLAGFVFAPGCGVKGPPRPPETKVPEGPKSLRAWIRDGHAVLIWKTADDANRRGYLIERAEIKDSQTFPDFQEIAGLPAQARYYLDNGIAAEGQYAYRVIALGERETRSKSSAVVKLKNLPAPRRPENLRAVAGDRFVELGWQGGPAELFNVYCLSSSTADNGLPEDLKARRLNAEPVPGDKYVDGALRNGEARAYLVRGVVLEQGFPMVEGAAGEPVRAAAVDLIPPADPAGLAAVSVSEGVKLRWLTSEEPDLLGYKVYRRDKGRTPFGCLTPDPIKDPFYVDQSARKGREYEYAVSAVDNAPSHNESQVSSVEIVYIVP